MRSKLFWFIVIYIIIISLWLLLACDREIKQLEGEPDSCYDARVRAIVSEKGKAVSQTEVLFSQDCVKSRKWLFCLDPKNRPDGMTFKDCLLLKY